jgi:hypothetical protein
LIFIRHVGNDTVDLRTWHLAGNGRNSAIELLLRSTTDRDGGSTCTKELCRGEADSRTSTSNER